MLIRFSKKEREYILEEEREGFYDKEIARLKEEIEKLEDEQEKENQLKALEEFEEEASKRKARLEKYGPTVWKIKSASKEALSRALVKIKGVKLSTNDLTDGEISTNILEYSRLKAIVIVKLGLVGWSNLRDEDGNEVPFSKDAVDLVIDSMPDNALMELANEISGEVKADEAKN